MSHKLDTSEIVHEGWLTKSPPSKRIWRARWRKRWFVLRHSGELPGQYYLYYYTDINCRTLKGQIDLDQCDQVDAGLEFESNKHKYRFMFDIRTSKRTYYLAAESEAEMNKWVDCVCHVCGLKAFIQDENVHPCELENTTSSVDSPNQAVESPPVSPSSTASGPYIPISECTSGKPIEPIVLSEEYYDSPRSLHPPTDYDFRPSESATPPLQSPGTDVESVFTDEEWTNSKPLVNWETFPHPSDSSIEEATKQAINPNIRKYKKPIAPPRPPKPEHLLFHGIADKHTYLNIEEPNLKESSKTENIVNDMYDFPRSHQLHNDIVLDPVPAPRKHCYLNAAPSTSGNYFCYDFESITSEEPNSPHSDESGLHHSNVSTPVSLTNPPLVHRELKPGRKTSDSISNEPSPKQPNVNLTHLRNLKPVPNKHRSNDDNTTLGTSPSGRSDYPSHFLHSPLSKTRIEILDIDSRNNELDEISIRGSGRFSLSSCTKLIEIQYLDLDLESSNNIIPSSVEIPQSTVYKEVDFVKTEAFNRTRQKVEEERKQCSDAH